MSLRRRLLRMEVAEKVLNGSFTPSEATLELTINVGEDFEHILIYIDDSDNIVGNGYKSCGEIFFHAEKEEVFVLSTNNAGTSATGFAGKINQFPSIRITKNDTEIAFASTVEIGSVFGFFVPVQYNWIAW